MTEQEWQIVRIVSSHATYQEASIALSQLTEDRAGYAIVPITAPDARSGAVCISERDLYEIRDALRYLPFEHRKHCVAAIDAAIAAAGSDPA